MKMLIFTLAIVASNYAMACSVTPIGYYNWTVNAVMKALTEDKTAEFFEVVSITNTNNGNEYAVILKEDDLIETRVYSVKEKDGTVCGEYKATRLEN